MTNEKALYRFTFNSDTTGTLIGLFVAEKQTVSNAIGKEFRFDAVLGKHPDLSGTLTEEMLKIITDDPEFCQQFQFYGCNIGANPLRAVLNAKG